MAESFSRRVARWANAALHPVGLHLAKNSHAFEMGGLLARAAARQHPIGTWIDVGASDGSWSLQARRYFPRASFLLFEPLTERQPVLLALQRKYGFKIVAAAAGANRGETSFAVADDLDGSVIASPGTANARTVRVETLSTAVADHALHGPFGIKLDTHGFEIPILEGAASLLSKTELLVIEAYNFKLTSSSLRFHELCTWLESRGFRCCDLADPMRRARDGALWQMDLAFTRAEHPMFASNRYR